MGMPEPRPEAGRKPATTTVRSEAAPAGAETLDAATVQAVVKETKDLIRSLEGTGTRRVRIKAGRLEIEVERRLRAASPAAGAQPAAPGSSGAAAAPATTPGRMPVVSPLVGVFYRAGSPGAKPFVEVGDRVERGQQVGIVEAMKMMNEVASDYTGTVAEILVANGDTVQYEQTLMLIDVGGG